MLIDYSTAFASLGTTVGSAITSALPVIVPVFAALVGLGVFVGLLSKFGLRR